MEKVLSGIASGIGSVISKVLGSPLDFLYGKSCSSVCAPTWDFICYIENFCVPQLFKFAMVALLLYFVLFFFYLLYEVGICKCICWTSCKIVWGCISTWFSVWESCCYFLFHKLRHIKRIRRGRCTREVEEHYYANSCDVLEDENSSSSSSSSASNNEVGKTGKKRKSRRNYKRDHLRRSLRPQNHHVQARVCGNSSYVSRKNSALDDHIRMARTSKFAHKGSSYRGSKHKKRR